MNFSIKKIYMLVFILFFSSQFTTYGQNSKNAKYEIETSIDRYLLNVNNIKLPLNSAGLIGNVYVDSVGLGYIDDYLFLYSAGFYLSGFNERGDLWSNSVSLDREDYIEGKVGYDSTDERNGIYVLKKSDTPFGNSWQEWKNAVELGAYFYDGDNDGTYNPIDKNSNGIWDEDEDKPDILGDETAWCVFNDGKPKEERSWNNPSDPQGIEVRQTVWAYSDGNELDNVIFLRYSILNSGDSSSIHDSVFFSLWTDPDLDQPWNDLAGCDTNLNAGYVYNDSRFTYNEEQMCFLSSLLQSPKNFFGEQSGLMNNEVLISSYFVEYDFLTFVRPRNPQQARNVLTGKDVWGNRTDPCTSIIGSVFNSSCEEVNPVFLLSGDPILKQGWIDTVVNEKRLFLNTGPFKLEVGKPIDIIGAYIVGRDTSELSSFKLTRQMAVRVREFYESNFTEYPVVSVKEEPTILPNKFKLHQNYPNPFNPTTTIKYEIPDQVLNHNSVNTLHAKTNITVYDILGRKVKTLVNEPKIPGSHTFQFDASELSSGVYFYKLQSGDFIQTRRMILLR